jgi:hypothetical protein
LRTLVGPPIKMLLASAAMGVGLWVPMRLLDRYVFDTTRVVPLIILTGIVGLIGALVYLTLAYLFRIREVMAYTQLFIRLAIGGKLWKNLMK